MRYEANQSKTQSTKIERKREWKNPPHQKDTPREQHKTCDTWKTDTGFFYKNREEILTTTKSKCKNKQRKAREKEPKKKL